MAKSKRLKKKQLLETQVAGLIASCILLTENLKVSVAKIENLEKETKLLQQRIDTLEELQAQNTLAINERFEQLEVENKALHDEIDELKRKKSFWKRK